MYGFHEFEVHVVQENLEFFSKYAYVTDKKINNLKYTFSNYLSRLFMHNVYMYCGGKKRKRWKESGQETS